MLDRSTSLRLSGSNSGKNFFCRYIFRTRHLTIRKREREKERINPRSSLECVFHRKCHLRKKIFIFTSWSLGHGNLHRWSISVNFLKLNWLSKWPLGWHFLVIGVVFMSLLAHVDDYKLSASRTLIWWNSKIVQKIMKSSNFIHTTSKKF